MSSEPPISTSHSLPIANFSPPPSDVISPPSPSGTFPVHSWMIGLFTGIGIGAVAMLVCVYLRKSRMGRRRERNMGLLGFPGVPSKGPKDDPFGVSPHHWKANAPPRTDNAVAMLSNPTFLHVNALNSQLSPGRDPSPHALPSPSNSWCSPSPGISLGFTMSTFTYEELAAATDGFSSANLLGQGGFGYVHKGVLANGKEVAIKQLKAGSGQGEREFKAEVDIISRIHHKHLVSLVGYCISGAQRMLVYEFVPNNTLEFHLHGKDRPNMSWETRMKIALGSAKGLAYLHEDCHPKIIHRDIKASNILLDYNFEAKVADFGLAKISYDADTHVSTRVMGTFGYLAPEYAGSGQLTHKSDVFSYGVMLVELITGCRPFDKTQPSTEDSMVDRARPLLTQAIEEGNFDTLVDPRLQKELFNYSEMRRMIACAAICVRHSARFRPRMSQVVRALEGDISFDDLSGRIGTATSYGSSDYETISQYKEELKTLRKMLQSQDPIGFTDQYPSTCSSEDEQSFQSTEMGRN